VTVKERLDREFHGYGWAPRGPYRGSNSIALSLVLENDQKTDPDSSSCALQGISAKEHVSDTSQGSRLTVDVYYVHLSYATLIAVVVVWSRSCERHQ